MLPNPYERPVPTAEPQAPIEPLPEPPVQRRKRRSIVIAGVSIAAVGLIGAGIASAQSSPSPSSSSGASSAIPSGAPHFPGGPGRAFRGGPGGFAGPGRSGGAGFAPGAGPGGPGGGGILHGEFVRRNRAGGYETMDVQLGKVTAVSSSSITLKSDDGYSKTYSVDTNTVVDAGRDGIANVKTGDTADLNAVVTGSDAKAVSILDQTNLRALHNTWDPPPAAPSPVPTPTG